MRGGRTVALAAWVAAGWPVGASEPSATSSGAAPPAAASSTPSAASAIPKPAAPAPLSRAVALEPAGPSPLSDSGETVVDPAATFEVELSGRIADARLVLLDRADALVPARGTRELGATTRLALAPAAPLSPGSRYVLRLEGATARELRGGGRAFAPLSFAVLAAGTAPPEPKRKPSSRKRRR